MSEKSHIPLDSSKGDVSDELCTCVDKLSTLPVEKDEEKLMMKGFIEDVFRALEKCELEIQLKVSSRLLGGNIKLANKFVRTILVLASIKRSAPFLIDTLFN